MRKPGTVSQGKASVIRRDSHSAVGLVVTPIHRSRRRPSPKMNQQEQSFECQRRDDEEIHGCNPVGVVAEKSLPPFETADLAVSTCTSKPSTVRHQSRARAARHESKLTKLPDSDPLGRLHSESALSDQYRSLSRLSAALKGATTHRLPLVVVCRSFRVVCRGGASHGCTQGGPNHTRLRGREWT